MPRGFACVLVVLAFWPLTAAARGACPPVRLPAPARISGRVIDAKSKAGIGSVGVRLDGTASETTTAADGTFAFEDVTPGRHELVAVLAGFAASAPTTVDVASGAAVHVDLEYTLGLTTEVRGAGGRAPASPPAVSLGGAEMSGLQVASAVGGLDDVSRVMQLRPGVAPSQDDRNDLMVRGGGAYETSVRMDGFELPTGSHFAWPGSAGGGLSLIPSAVIQSVSLDTSGFSVAYGERASAVMEVKMRSGQQDAFRGRTDLSAGGVFALGEGRFPAPDGQTGSWMASVRRSILEVAFSRGDSRAVPSYVESMGNLDVPLSARHRLHVLGLATSDGLDVNWTTSSSTITGEQTLGVGGVRLSSAWSPKTQSDVSVAWSSNRSSLSEAQQSATSFQNKSLEHFLRVRAEVRRVLRSDVRLLAGTAVRRSSVNFDLQDGSYRNQWNIIVPAVRSTWHDRFADVAGYADVNWARGPFDFTAGVRADRSGVTARWYGSPRAKASVRLGSRWRFMGGWGEYRQDIPNVWLGSNAANRDLDPIQCDLTTAGVEGSPWARGWLTVEGFRKRYRGYPVDPSVPSRVLIAAGADFESPLVGRLVSSGLVNADGVDLSFAQDVWSGLTLSLGYSYWDVREHNLENRWIRADYDIRHQARAWLTWHRSKRWSASALWRYASGRPYTPYDVAASTRANTGRLDRTRTNAETYPAYHRLDVRVDRIFALRHAALTAFAEVDNVYDRDNIYIYDWSKALKQPKPVLQWGVTPVAGIRIDF